MRLLLAVDIQDQCKELVALAAQWAQRLGAVVDLVYVDDTFFTQDPETRAILDKEWPRVRASREQRLQQLCEGLPPELRGEVLYRTGWAPGEIVEAAQGRDVLLIGTHGRRGLQHTLLGSVAERVIRLSTVPVLVLRQLAPR
jgi:nucleotide-binding universal stress UspA family protein